MERSCHLRTRPCSCDSRYSIHEHSDHTHCTPPCCPQSNGRKCCHSSRTTVPPPPLVAGGARQSLWRLPRRREPPSSAADQPAGRACVRGRQSMSLPCVTSCALSGANMGTSPDLVRRQEGRRTASHATPRPAWVHGKKYSFLRHTLKVPESLACWNWWNRYAAGSPIAARSLNMDCHPATGLITLYPE